MLSQRLTRKTLDRYWERRQAQERDARTRAAREAEAREHARESLDRARGMRDYKNYGTLYCS